MKKRFFISILLVLLLILTLSCGAGEKEVNKPITIDRIKQLSIVEDSNIKELDQTDDRFVSFEGDKAEYDFYKENGDLHEVTIKDLESINEGDKTTEDQAAKKADLILKKVNPAFSDKKLKKETYDKGSFYSIEYVEVGESGELTQNMFSLDISYTGRFISLTYDRNLHADYEKSESISKEEAKEIAKKDYLQKIKVDGKKDFDEKRLYFDGIEKIVFKDKKAYKVQVLYEEELDKEHTIEIGGEYIIDINSGDILSFERFK